MTTTDAQQTADYLAGMITTLQELQRLTDDHNNATAEEIKAGSDELAADLAESFGNHTNEEHAEQIAEINRLLADAKIIGDEYHSDEGLSYAESYAESALDIEIIGTLDKESGIWDADEIRLLMSFNGPDARIIYTGSNSWLTVQVAWWGKPITAGVYCPALAEYLNHLIECYA